jgi:hypothetical protein
MSSVLPSTLLRVALSVDAIVSVAVAALQAATSGWMETQLRLPHALLTESALFLLGYAAALWVLARRPSLRVVWVSFIVWGNVAWAMACLGLLLNGMASGSALGQAYLLVQVAAVLAFAAAEFRGLRNSQPSPNGMVHSAR